MRIIIIGNSVGLRVRPPSLNRAENLTFSSVLDKKLQTKGVASSVKNMCRGRHLIEEMVQEVDDYIREFPDVFIIVSGVTDVCNREIPLFYSNIIRERSSSILRNLLMATYVYIIARFRPYLVFLRGRRPWRSKSFTEKKFFKLINELKKNTTAKIFVLSVLPVNSRVESLLPGSNKNISLFNNYLRELCEVDSKELCFIDLGDGDDLERPDGIHLNINGHKALADKLLAKII